MCNFKIILLGCLLTTTSWAVFGQQTAAHRDWRFQSVNTAGLLEGQTGSAFQLQTINGAKYKSWYAGIGTGLDYYRLRTIPLFLSIQKEFSKANSFFVYGNAGMNFFWKRDKDVSHFPVYDKYKNSFFAETGVGYKFRVPGSGAILLSGGYSYKKITEQGNNLYFYDPGFPYPPPGSEKINYGLNRLVIKAGIEF